MIGAILHQELLLGSRRNRLHIFRWIYGGWLVLQVIILWFAFIYEDGKRRKGVIGSPTLLAYNQLSAPHVVGEWFAKAFVSQQALLLVLVTPALVAGAIADEKSNGMMQYLLTTQLDTRHIVLGKMLGRAAQVVLLSMVGYPLFGLMAGFGGVSPSLVLLSFAALVVPLLGVAAASMLASVLCRQTRDAVLALFAVGLVVWLGLYLAGLVRTNDPFAVLYILEPVWGQRSNDGLPESLRRLGILSACWGIVGIVCLGLAIWRLRPAYTRQLEGHAPGGVRWYQVERPPVYDDPVRWRERNVEGLSPLPALRRIPQWLAISAVVLATVISSLLILHFSLPPGVGVTALMRTALRFNLIKLKTMLPGAEFGFLMQSLVVLLIASLVVGVRCSGAITGERERQTWEALLLTPLTAPEIVRGKLWGVMASSYWYLLAYAAPAVALSALGGLQAVFSTVLWLAVTVLAMYYLGAAGLWSSVRSSNSWYSLLSTMGFGYLGGAAVYGVASPLIFLLAFVIIGMLIVVDYVLNTQLAQVGFGGMTRYWSAFIITTSFCLAIICFLLSRFFLAWTQSWIADRDRTRHWQDEPYYRRSRRPLYDSPRYRD
jgi:ABC-type transport system involved in multi-copper enzyme maturation permease subunit